MIALVAAVVIALLLSMWVGRPLLAKYLASRSMSRAHTAVADYLAGRSPLDSAAQRWNHAMTDWSEYQHTYFELTAAYSNGQSWARITDSPWAPAGYRADDPRIQELMDRALLLQVGPAQYEQIKQSLRQRRGQDGSTRQP